MVGDRGWRSPASSAPPSSGEVQDQLDTRVEQLLESGRNTLGPDDEPSDSFTTVYGGGLGLIMYAVVHSHQRITVLRVV